MLRDSFRTFSFTTLTIVVAVGLLAPPASAGDRSAPPKVSDLSGRYYFSSFFHPTRGSTVEEAVTTAGAIRFDGAGGFTRQVEFDSSTGAPGPRGSGVYDVAPDGRLTVANGPPFGLIGKGTDFLVVPGLSPFMDDSLGLLFASRAHLPVIPIGRYYFVTISHGVAIGNPDEFDADAGYVDFDGHGNYTVHVQYPPDAVEDGFGVYDVRADGRISVDGGLPYGMISADGELMIVPTLEGDDRSISFLMREGAPLPVSAITGRYDSLEIFHDAPAHDFIEMTASAGYVDFDGRGHYFIRSTYEDGVGQVDDRGAGTYGIDPDGRAFADDEPHFILVSADGGLLIAPHFAPGSTEKGVSILTRAPRFCGSGNVNLGEGPIADVLFINESSGGADRVVTVATGQPLEFSLDAAPAGSGRGAYILWGWSRLGASCGDVTARHQVIGCTLNPTPLTPLLGPQPALCLYGEGVPAALHGSGRCVAGPPAVPFSVRDRDGLHLPLDLIMQGLIQDRGAANTLGFSVTNPIVLHVVVE